MGGEVGFLEEKKAKSKNLASNWVFLLVFTAFIAFVLGTAAGKYQSPPKHYGFLCMLITNMKKKHVNVFHRSRW